MPEVTQQVVELGSTQVVQLLSGPAQDLVRPPGSPGPRRGSPCLVCSEPLSAQH